MESIFNLSNYYLNPHAIVYFISGILITAEAVFILFQNKKSLINITFAFCPLFAGIWLTGVGMIYSSSTQSVAFFWSRAHSFLGIIFVTPAVYLFSESWKTQDAKKINKMAYGNFFISAIFYLLCLFTNYIIDGVYAYKWGFYPKAGRGEILFILWFYFLTILSFRNFVISYRRETIPIRKKQTRLIFIAFVFGFTGSLDFIANFGVPFYTFAAGTVLFFTTTVAYAIVQYKLMQIETVIHKTIAWFITSVSLVTPLAAILYFTRDWYNRLPVFGLWAYFGVLLLLLLAMVKTLQPRIDHFFQRRRANMDLILTKFTADLVHLKSINEVVSEIEKTIYEGIYPQKIDIFLYDEAKGLCLPANGIYCPDDKLISKAEEGFVLWLKDLNKIAYRDFAAIDPAYSGVKQAALSYFDSFNALAAIPLVLNDKLIGIINLSKKSNLKRYNAADFYFLTVLKNQATIAISNSLLYENMEEQVRQRTKELVEVQKQLIQAEKLATVGTLAGGVAHEINNPLTAILTNVQMLLTFGPADDKLDVESLQMIEEATKRCRSIVQKLMVYARKPLETTQAAEANVADVIRKAVAFLTYQFQQDNVRMTFETDSDTYTIIADPNELEQVLTNIILNARDAIKKAKPAGNIHIRLFKQSPWINIIIRDDGAGIPQEILTKIFDPFFTTKDVGKGLGLGLSICQAIIEKLKGRISARSDPGEGAEFTIQLPAQFF